MRTALYSIIIILLCLSKGMAASFNSARSCLPSGAEKSVQSARVPDKDIAKAIGWITSSTHENLCGGYYEEPLLDFTKRGLINPQDSEVSAKHVSLFEVGCSSLRGDVVVKQPERLARADSAHIYRNKSTGKITHIALQGRVHIREPGKLLIADSAQLNLKNKTGVLNHVLYRFARSDRNSTLQGIHRLYGINAWGQASQVKQLRPGVYELIDGSYATCPPTHTSWQITAKKITIDRNVGTGYAHGVYFRWKKKPLVYLPYFMFPVDDKRKSGFLFPTMSYTNKSGLDITLPYYLNLAPNYDATLSPRLLAKRGVLWGGEFRYLSPRGSSIVYAEFLPEDREFKKFKRANPGISSLGNHRASISVINTTQINPHWMGSINFHAVSDDYFLQDLYNTLASATTYHLLQQADLHYADAYWNFFGRVEHYQTLHPRNQKAVGDVYGRLPQFVLDFNYPNVPGMSFYVHNEYVNFVWPTNSPSKPSGLRLTVAPQVSFPRKSLSGFFTPTVELFFTQYNLSQQMLGLPSHIHEATPIISLDTGLYFDRYFHLMGHSYQQTLEPRLYYLYVPFNDQDVIPLFDTSIYTFTFSQLFRNNRFTGGDRIGDANQTSIALMSRLINKGTGREIGQVGIGGIVYFRDRKVGYCTGRQCSDFGSGTAIRYLSPTAQTSPVIGFVNYHVTPDLSAQADLAWDTHHHNTHNASVYLHYQPEPSHVVNVGYTFQRKILTTDAQGGNTLENAKQINFSYAVPLTKRWHFLGSWGYNLSYKHPQTYFLGAQYNSCCWAMRALAGRTLTEVSQTHHAKFNNVFYIQVLFKGLGTVGNNRLSKFLVSDIPGYHDSFSHLN